MGNTTFNNEGDAYEAGRDINVGLTLEGMLKIISSANIKQAKSIEEFHQVIEVVFGMPYESLPDAGISDTAIWKKIKDHLSSIIPNSLNIDSLTDNQFELLQNFYDLINDNKLEEASEVKDKIIDGVKLDNSSLAFRYYLEGEICRVEGNYLQAFNLTQQAVDKSPSEIYINQGITLAANYLQRGDLAMGVFAKWQDSGEPIAINLLASYQAILARLEEYDKVEEIYEKIKADLIQFECNDFVMRTFIHVEQNYIYSKIQIAARFKTNLSQDEELNKLLNRQKQNIIRIDGQNSLYLAQTYLHNKARLLQIDFAHKKGLIELATIHEDLTEKSILRDCPIFMKLNYFDPILLLEKCLDLTNEVHTAIH